MRTIIVTRHAGLVEWLARHGITGEVISHVSEPETVRGRVVIGALPMHLAAETECIGSVSLPGLPPEKRGAELTVEEMEAAGAHLCWYVVAAAASEANAHYLRGALMHG